MQIAVQHIHSAPVPPSRRTELAIPDALEGAILACLEKAPEGRPADAENLARRLFDCKLESGTSSALGTGGKRTFRSKASPNPIPRR